MTSCWQQARRSLQRSQRPSRPFGRPRLSLSQRQSIGADILVQGSGFLLGQQAHTDELLRLNDVKPTALGKIPCPKDLVSFDTLLTDEAPTEETVRTAQRLTGEIVWLSQCTRPDLAFTACVFASLSTKAPQRAIRIAEKALAYVQRSKGTFLTAEADDMQLVAYSDASYAPEGNRSHIGWVVFLHGSPVLEVCAAELCHPQHR